MATGDQASRRPLSICLPPSHQATTPSFAQRTTSMDRERPRTAHLVEGDGVILRDIDQPLPGDVVYRRKPSTRQDVAKRRSTYFEDAFAAREANGTQDRIRGETIVLAEVKTNVIVEDEFTFITQLSDQLAARYRRPVSSITVTLDHGACLLFGGKFDPAYILNVTAISSVLQPATNKRNAALLQKHLEQALGVVPARGLVHFNPMPEENVANSGRTVAAHIEDAGKLPRVEQPDQPDVSRKASGKPKRKLSVKSIPGFKASARQAPPAPDLTPPRSSGQDSDDFSEKEFPVPAPTKKRSFVASLFGRGASHRHGAQSPLPTVPQE